MMMRDLPESRRENLGKHLRKQHGVELAPVPLEDIKESGRKGGHKGTPPRESLRAAGEKGRSYGAKGTPSKEDLQSAGVKGSQHGEHGQKGAQHGHQGPKVC